jgi:hypothetical protein
MLRPLLMESEARSVSRHPTCGQLQQQERRKMTSA